MGTVILDVPVPVGMSQDEVVAVAERCVMSELYNPTGVSVKRLITEALRRPSFTDRRNSDSGDATPRRTVALAM